MNTKSKLLSIVLLLILLTATFTGCSENYTAESDYIQSVVGKVPEFTAEIMDDFDWDNQSQDLRISLIQSCITQCAAMEDKDVSENDFNITGTSSSGKIIFTWSHKDRVVTMWVNGEKQIIDDPFN